MPFQLGLFNSSRQEVMVLTQLALAKGATDLEVPSSTLQVLDGPVL